MMTWTPQRETVINLALALCGGVLLHVAFGLHPVWWLAWIAPAPLLLAALRSTWRVGLGLAFAGALVASSALLPFFARVMPLPAALLVTVLSGLPWVAGIALARRVMTRWASPWAVLAYPVITAAIDTLLMHLTLDGNWGSIAHAQAGFPPAVQVLALAGVAGLVFVMSLLPAALALAAHRGWRTARAPLLAAVLLAAGSFAYGWLRIPAVPVPPGDLVGIAVIDDGIWPRTPAAQGERIWTQYERHVEALGAQGARIVVLPEKIAVLGAADADRIARRLASLAARTRVWLVAGVGTDDGGVKRNLAWMFGPDGQRVASYQKHHMAPPEREFVPGPGYDVRMVGGVRYGLAICKDMHFAGMGRAYGTRAAAAMLVPAWDFGIDGVYEARLSALRGVESGFAMVRGAREGLLTVTDAYGRIVAETRSARLPGATLLSRVPAQPPLATPYGRMGDLFGWLCVAGAVAVLVGTSFLRRNMR